jgi:hypothetical protein
MSKLNGYQLSRKWFDFAFEKKEAKVQHTALYLWLVELNNRLGWKEEFQLPTLDTMEGLSIGNKSTYLSTLKDLADWKFVEIVKESKNQYQATVVKLCRSESVTAGATALDTALKQHSTQHGNGTGNSIEFSIGTGSVPIDKQVNNETKKQENQETDKYSFDDFWNLYGKKNGKKAAQANWNKLTAAEKILAVEKMSNHKFGKEPQFWKDPERYLKDKRWEDTPLILKPNNTTKTNPTDLIPNPEQYLGYNKYYHEDNRFYNKFENQQWIYVRMV